MTELGSGHFGESDDEGEHTIEQFGMSLESLGRELFRKRNFLGRMVAHEYMEQLGLSKIGNDQDQARLTDTLGRYVVNGMLLKTSDKVDADSVETTVALLREALPDDLQDSIGLLVPLFVERGIEFQTAERGSEKEQAWMEEYALLRDTDPA